MMDYKLFLDDFRIPEDAAKYMHRRIGSKNPIYLTDNWIIVKNYNRFVGTVKYMGLPVFVSFDHDLAEDCYGREMGKKEMEKFYKKEDREMTGYDCAKWLIRYCITKELKFPEWAVHSMNPVGVNNIERIIESFKLLPK